MSYTDELIKYREKYFEILNQWYELIHKIKKDIFEEYCLKDNKSKCEPEHCVYRINGKCKYFSQLQIINDIIGFKNSNF